MLLNITIMKNYLVVLILSVFVLLGALYVHKVEQKLVIITDELLQHGNEIKEVKDKMGSSIKALTHVKVELELATKELIQVKVELDSTKKEVKQVKVELDSTKKEVKQVKVELDSTKKELAQVKVELETSKKEVKQVQEELGLPIEEVKQVKEELESTIQEVTQVKVELYKTKTELHTKRPGFYVTLSSHTPLHQTQRIEFDQVITDITKTYNKMTGIFTVPKDGLYHFSFTMFSTKDRLHAEIMHNHQVIGRNLGTSIYVSATINVVISCKQGDSVFVRHKAGVVAQTIYGDGFSAFSGFLIY